jgi:hypothetical protein
MLELVLATMVFFGHALFDCSSVNQRLCRTIMIILAGTVIIPWKLVGRMFNSVEELTSLLCYLIMLFDSASVIHA